MAFAGCGASSSEPSTPVSGLAGEDLDTPASRAVEGERLHGTTPLNFRFASATGGPDVTSQQFRGRMTVIALIATYDAASQAEARFLSTLHRNHRPRINVAAVVVEPPANLPLVVTFRDALGLDYPLGFADPENFLGAGPFGETRAVPSVFILDAEGRMVWRHLGLAKAEEIEAALNAP